MNERLRDFKDWYTVENTYCLLRLWQEQTKRKGKIAYKNVDRWYKKFLAEIGHEMPEGATLKQMLNHDDDLILYSSCEDMNIIMDYLTDSGDYQCKEEISWMVAFMTWDEVMIQRYGVEEYMSYEDIVQHLNDEIAEADAEEAALEATKTQNL